MPDAEERRATVSIVTPSYNQGPYVEKTILSVLRQDYPNIEYVIMDANSKDETAAIIDKYRAKFAYVSQEKDEGQADAIDKGFKHTSGEIMAYLNSDDCYASADVVSLAVQAFEDHPEIDVVYGKRQLIDKYGFYLDSHPFRECDEYTLRRACFVPQECVFWRRSAFDRAGGFVDKSFQFAMDYDLWFRLLDANAKFMAIDHVFGLFRFYPDQKTNAVWQERGLPEIARLHSRQLGHTIEEKTMLSYEKAFHYGTNRAPHVRAHDVGKHLWDVFRDFKREVLAPYALDNWVLDF